MWDNIPLALLLLTPIKEIKTVIAAPAPIKAKSLPFVSFI